MRRCEGRVVGDIVVGEGEFGVVIYCMVYVGCWRVINRKVIY